MLKKFLSILLIFFCSETFAASPYPKYLQNDKNLLIIAGHQGVAWYLKLDSVQVECCRLPFHVASVKLVNAVAKDCYAENFDMLPQNEELELTFYYDAENSKMYTLEKNGVLNFVNPEGCYAESGITLPVGRYLWQEIFAKRGLVANF